MSEDVSFHALAVPSRRHILDALRAGDGPLGVKELAAATELHPNTVRFHLDVLADAGLLTRERTAPDGRGRPQIRYRAVTPPAPPTGYQFLSEVLAAQLDRGRAGDLAEQAGRSWLRSVGRPAPPPPGADTVEVATTRAIAVFSELGFQPSRDAGVINLSACPFQDVARRHPDVVCGMHRGLLREVVETVTPHIATDLVPFARPGVCVARLTAVDKEMPR
ncbi:helix-turn-helix domain-containing protein [Micromonospora sp. WMMA1363]|uniref:helix-turn-helix transcriptional regulator n=1 Tax=Micromonospora sp. WMMA1363 TaxID=3053985 RepID=UPI00259C9BEF|nr:helix-turn-helix domain-containing protein [Micromonospora sp. WMMA1363]MDM4718688.1 helix-turn-helix domain-containing protein [Micromonospora sp. WMMA1363]